ncbi:hypothetical protein TNCV_1675841 [Trichonephila clavipes]|nr:hypothetical protein TNCV_1675841 [Trichonephila clavipes]
MTAQRYIRDILQTDVSPLMVGLPRAIFQQYNAHPHTERDSLYHIRYISSPSLACSIPRFVADRVYLGSFWTALESIMSLVQLRLYPTRAFGTTISGKFSRSYEGEGLL